MITIPLTTVLEKIKETGLTDEEIDTKIKQKMDQLSGLISREGAAHIIANELGIKLVHKISGKVKIKEVLAGMRSIEIVGKVIAVFEPVKFEREGRQSKVHNFIIADETGTIKIVCWGNQADVSATVSKDMVVKVVGGYAKENQGRKEIHLNDMSKLILNPPGEVIETVALAERTFSRMKISEMLANPNAGNGSELLATIVAVDAIRFFEVCPQCNARARKVREDGSEYRCDQHGIVAMPDYSYVMGLVLDDGTDNIRAVLFREMVEKVLSLDKNAIIGMKDATDLQTIKQSVVGTIVKAKGKLKKNKLFDRNEFNVMDIDITPDPYEEMAALDEEIEKAKKASAVTSIDEI